MQSVADELLCDKTASKCVKIELICNEESWWVEDTEGHKCCNLVTCATATLKARLINTEKLLHS